MSNESYDLIQLLKRSGRGPSGGHQRVKVCGDKGITETVSVHILLKAKES